MGKTVGEPRRRIALVTDAIGPYHRGGKEQRYLELSSPVPRVRQLLAITGLDRVFTIRADSDTGSSGAGSSGAGSSGAGSSGAGPGEPGHGAR